MSADFRRGTDYTVGTQKVNKVLVGLPANVLVSAAKAKAIGGPGLAGLTPLADRYVRIGWNVLGQ